MDARVLGGCARHARPSGESALNRDRPSSGAGVVSGVIRARPANMAHSMEGAQAIARPRSPSCPRAPAPPPTDRGQAFCRFSQNCGVVSSALASSSAGRRSTRWEAAAIWLSFRRRDGPGCPSGRSGPPWCRTPQPTASLIAFTALARTPLLAGLCREHLLLLGERIDALASRARGLLYNHELRKAGKHEDAALLKLFVTHGDERLDDPLLVLSGDVLAVGVDDCFQDLGFREGLLGRGLGHARGSPSRGARRGGHLRRGVNGRQGSCVRRAPARGQLGGRTPRRDAAWRVACREGCVVGRSCWLQNRGLTSHRNSRAQTGQAASLLTRMLGKVRPSPPPVRSIGPW